MKYLTGFSLPDLEEEMRFLHPRDLTAEEVSNGVVIDRRGQFSRESTYPFEILPRFHESGDRMGSSTCTLGDITIFYGTNGCGKTTLLNVIAEKNQAEKRRTAEKREYSNGESALLFFTENMEKEGLYILDEPENSLSFENQKYLAAMIEGWARFNNSQFIIATHSPLIAGISGAKIYSFEDGYIEKREWQELPGIKELYQYFKENEFRFHTKDSNRA